MIENFNASKNSSGEFVDIKKYIGVASINILAINPDNNKLRSYGWSIPEDAEEPKYLIINEDGKKSARIRFLVQIQDLEEKPIIALDFWARPELQLNSDGTKCKIIDSYGRTAWATKSEVQSHSIPQYANGPASISPDYKPCHSGEESLVLFLMKWLNMTPPQIMINGAWTASTKPGRLTIDNWAKLFSGTKDSVDEIAGYVAAKADNRCKVILGVRKNDENRSYQTFLPTCFLANGSPRDLNGNYPKAAREIERYMNGRDENSVIFSAANVAEYKETATEVTDNSANTAEDGDLPF